MTYARINLNKVTYKQKAEGWRYSLLPNVVYLNDIFVQYCKHKKFKSVMPIFESEYTDLNNDVLEYFDGNEVVAFSIIRRYDRRNAECVQFAWNYANPGLRLGIESLKHECALYRDRGYQYLYLGGAEEYKHKIEGFEILGPVEELQHGS